MEILPALRVCLCLLIGGLLFGCKARLNPFDSTLPIPPSDERPSDEPLYLAKLHYQNGDYGVAEQYYRRAVEANQHSMDAWLGLAACYDRLRRFDLAARAYEVLIRRVGYTAAVLNNLGYHHLLQGNLPKARKYLMAAYAKAPEDPYIQHNLHLLKTWPTAGGGAVR